MSTIKVKPTTSAWGTSTFTSTPSMSASNPASVSDDMEEWVYLALLLLSLTGLILSFVLKRKS
jgi:hypothetical protein